MLKKHKKVATTVYLRPDQDEALKMESARTGMSIANLIRAGIDRELEWSQANRGSIVTFDRGFFRAMLTLRAEKQAEVCAEVISELRQWPAELAAPTVDDLLIAMGLRGEVYGVHGGPNGEKLRDRHGQLLVYNEVTGGLEPTDEEYEDHAGASDARGVIRELIRGGLVAESDGRLSLGRAALEGRAVPLLSAAEEDSP